MEILATFDAIYIENCIQVGRGHIQRQRERERETLNEYVQSFICREATALRRWLTIYYILDLVQKFDQQIFVIKVVCIIVCLIFLILVLLNSLNYCTSYILNAAFIMAVGP